MSESQKVLFMEVMDIRRGPVFTFVTPMGISRGVHSSFVHSQLTAKDLFIDIPNI